jgi:methylated-DNA-[protein]-cysteine S-methyltransferase
LTTKTAALTYIMSDKLPSSILKKVKNYPSFFQKTWIACSKIPIGETLTYKELAKKIGRPKAWRAVANALAKNPFAPIVPCHRVICSNGKLGGYSGPGGLKTKKRLLEKEKNERT